MTHLVARELCLNLEGAYAVNLVAEEVDTEGVFRGVGEDVDDATTHGKLPRLIHIVDPLEALAHKRCFHLGELYGVAHGQGHGAVSDRVARHHHLGQGVGIGDDV